MSDDFLIRCWASRNSLPAAAACRCGGVRISERQRDSQRATERRTALDMTHVDLRHAAPIAAAAALLCLVLVVFVAAVAAAAAVAVSLLFASAYPVSTNSKLRMSSYLIAVAGP